MQEHPSRSIKSDILMRSYLKLAVIHLVCKLLIKTTEEDEEETVQKDIHFLIFIADLFKSELGKSYLEDIW